MALHPRIDDLLELRHQAHTLGIASRHLVNSTFTGLYASVFRGAGLNFEEVREYREGDDIRNMDWKVTARTNEPHLKVFREERERSVILCVDNGPHMSFGTRGTFKSIQAARAAALLGWAASRQHDRVGGLLFGDSASSPQYFRPSPGGRSLWRLLRALTDASSPGTSNIDCLAAALRRADRGATTGSLIIVIGDFNRDLTGADKVFGSLVQRHGVVLVPIDDPADQEIPAMGSMVFMGPDGELIEVNTSDPKARQVYRNAWSERRNNLVALTNRLNMLMLPLRTDQDIHSVLLQELQRYAGSRVI